MSNIVPFENAPLPAHLKQFESIVSGDDLTAGASGGFPIISIKGKVFHIVRGDERVLVTRPGTEEPAGSLEVVILRANPALSKIYYEKKYEEGSDEKPTCYSTDGVAPAQDAAVPQSVKCATCAHNQWGSKITESGAKGKECADSRRLAVAPLGQLNDVMLLRVPAASLKPLAQYGDQLKKRGVAYPSVATLISFDWGSAYPSLTFKPVSFLTEPMMKAVADVLRSDVPGNVAGVNAVTRAPAPATAPAPVAALPAPQPAAPVPAPVVTAPVQVAPPAQPVPAPAAAPKAAKKPAAKTVSFGGTAAPAPQPVAAPVHQAPKPTQTITVADDELTRELGAVLAGAGFDD